MEDFKLKEFVTPKFGIMPFGNDIPSGSTGDINSGSATDISAGSGSSSDGGGITGPIILG